MKPLPFALTRPALAAAGAAAIGWIVSLPHGAAAAARTAVATPPIVLGLAVGLCPALYVALALTRAETEPRRFADAVMTGLGAGGLAALALAGPLLFLAATSVDADTAFLFGIPALALAAIIGLTRLYRGAARRHTAASAGATVVWTMAALAIGARLLLAAIEWGNP